MFRIIATSAALSTTLTLAQAQSAPSAERLIVGVIEAVTTIVSHAPGAPDTTGADTAAASRFAWPGRSERFSVGFRLRGGPRAIVRIRF